MTVLKSASKTRTPGPGTVNFDSQELRDRSAIGCLPTNGPCRQSL
jgi:hypothetical protein